MLLKRYKKEFCRPPNPEAQHLRCVAYLNENIGDVLPYLNTVLKGHQFTAMNLSSYKRVQSMRYRNPWVVWLIFLQFCKKHNICTLIETLLPVPRYLLIFRLYSIDELFAKFL